MSLSRRLILILWLALTVVGAASACVAYARALSSANELLDYQLQQIAGFLVAQRNPDLRRPDPAVRVDVDHDEEDDIVVALFDEYGQPLGRSDPDAGALRVAFPGFRELRIRHADYRAFELHGNGRVIVVAQQIQTRREVAESAALSSLLPILVLLPVLGFAIYAVTRRTLRPLQALSAELSSRAALSMQPLPTDGLPLEIQPVVLQMNALLRRLGEAVEHEKRFIADAAHGLRTPLAALQLQADVLDGSGDPAEHGERLADLRRGIRRTARLAEHLLVLSRGGQRPAAAHRCAVDAVLREIVDQCWPLAEAGSCRIELATQIKADVAGDARLLGVLLGNLLDNALRYTPARGIVRVLGRHDAGSAIVEIVDEGPGLPESELEKVFERFYRVPHDESDGSGLGLAVVRSVSARLGGSVYLRNRTDRPGLIAEVRLPVVPA